MFDFSGLNAELWEFLRRVSLSFNLNRNSAKLRADSSNSAFKPKN